MHTITLHLYKVRKCIQNKAMYYLGKDLDMAKYKRINERSKKRINNTKWFNHKTMSIIGF